MSIKRLILTMACIASLLASTFAIAQVKTAGKTATKPAVKAGKKATKAAAAAKLPIDAFANSPDSTVVGVVNGQKITKKQVIDYMWGQTAGQTLETRIISNVLIAQKAKKAGVTVTQKEIDAKLKEMEATVKPQTMNQALGEKGIGRNWIISQYVTPQLQVEKIVAKGIKVTDADVAQFIKASHILIRPKPAQTPEETKKNEDEAKARVEKIAADIKGGMDFAKAADENTEDPSGKGKGGDLGYFKTGAMVPEFDQAARALKVGEVSAPVKSQYGWHLIKLTALGKDATGAEKAKIKTNLLTERKGELMSKFYQDLKVGAKVENKLMIKAKTPPMPPAGRMAPRPPGGATMRPGQNTPPAPPR